MEPLTYQYRFEELLNIISLYIFTIFANEKANFPNAVC